MTLHVADYERSKSFYTAALKPLGYELLKEFGSFAGFGSPSFKACFWLRPGAPFPQFHFAFTAPTRAAVRAFHAAALAAGARDDGAPGLRPMYHPHYYGAFALDPDGYHIEAVCLTEGEAAG